jgi:hypothetical protein
MFIWKLMKTLNLISGVTVHRTINTIPAFVVLHGWFLNMELEVE